MTPGTYFITGIDTNIGKSYATGYLALIQMQAGKKVITQKMIQTGNEGFSEDIRIHRQIMNIPYREEDLNRLTAPCIRSYPCSPHLAAKLDGKPIDTDLILKATQELEQQYDIVLLEGAGGIMVPITEEKSTIDYICQQNYPLILITNGKLGSINHTLLTLEAIRQRNITLHLVIYNLYPEADPVIEKDSLAFIQNYLAKHFPESRFETMVKIEIEP